MSMQINLQHLFKMSASRAQTHTYIGMSLVCMSIVQRDRHGVCRSFKTRLHRVVFCRAGTETKLVYTATIDSAPAHRARETIELLHRETRRTLFHRNSGHRTVQILT